MPVVRLIQGYLSTIERLERVLKRARDDLRWAEEHMGRFEVERDEARSRLTTAEAEVTRLRAALERIAAYETDWTVGPAANVNVLQLMAERALSAIPAVPMTLDPIPRAVCTHPGFGEDGRCYTCNDVVAAGFPVEFARHVSEIYAARPQTAEPTPAKVCAGWCGTTGQPKPGNTCFHIDRPGDWRCYCTEACRDAGRPLNPTPGAER